MSLSNLHSFHFGQILQNAMALPEHSYQNINNHSSINRTLHQQSKLRRRKTKQRWNTKETSTPNTPTSQDTTHFTPSPFPEQRKPVVIDSETNHANTTPPPQEKNSLEKPGPTVPQHNTTDKKGLKAHTCLKTQALLEKRARLKKYAHLKQQTHSKNQAPPKKQALTQKQPRTPSMKATSKPSSIKQSANNTPLLRQKKLNQHAIWKPGRGTVEKIDRHTGEIVHLIEESAIYKKNA